MYIYISGYYNFGGCHSTTLYITTVLFASFSDTWQIVSKLFRHNYPTIILHVPKRIIRRKHTNTLVFLGHCSHDPFFENLTLHRITLYVCVCSYVCQWHTTMLPQNRNANELYLHIRMYVHIFCCCLCLSQFMCGHNYVCVCVCVANGLKEECRNEFACNDSVVGSIVE